MMMTLINISTIFGLTIEVYYILFILTIPTFFTWRWILKKLIKFDKERKIVTWIATIISTPFIYLILVLVMIFSISYYPTYDFKRENWFADKEKRYELSEDIIESKMLIGKTKTEVRQILGDEGNLEKNDHWGYYLGFRPGLMNIDPDVLSIEFKHGKVVKVEQHET